MSKKISRSVNLEIFIYMTAGLKHSKQQGGTGSRPLEPHALVVLKQQYVGGAPRLQAIPCSTRRGHLGVGWEGTCDVAQGEKRIRVVRSTLVGNSFLSSSSAARLNCVQQIVFVSFR